MSRRPSFDVYCLRMAYLVATRATCSRKHVGAVIVDDARRVVATGYNGSPAGTPHCDDPGVGHEMVDGHCVRTLHAESNALDYAGREARGCTIYTTVTPCYDCAKRLVNAGIKRAVWGEHYESRYGKSSDVPKFFEANHVLWNACLGMEDTGFGKLLEMDDRDLSSLLSYDGELKKLGEVMHASPRAAALLTSPKFEGLTINSFWMSVMKAIEKMPMDDATRFLEYVEES